MSEKQTKLFLESKAKCKIQSAFTLFSSDVSSSLAPPSPPAPHGPAMYLQGPLPALPPACPAWLTAHRTSPHLLLFLLSLLLSQG